MYDARLQSSRCEHYKLHVDGYLRHNNGFFLANRAFLHCTVCRLPKSWKVGLLKIWIFLWRLYCPSVRSVPVLSDLDVSFMSFAPHGHAFWSPCEQWKTMKRAPCFSYHNNPEIIVQDHSWNALLLVVILWGMLMSDIELLFAVILLKRFLNCKWR